MGTGVADWGVLESKMYLSPHVMLCFCTDTDVVDNLFLHKLIEELIYFVWERALSELFDSMLERMQVDIDADSLFTKY